MATDIYGMPKGDYEPPPQSAEQQAANTAKQQALAANPVDFRAAALATNPSGMSTPTGGQQIPDIYKPLMARPTQYNLATGASAVAGGNDLMYQAAGAPTAQANIAPIDPNVAMNQARSAFQTKLGRAMTPQEEQQLIASMGLQPGQPITQAILDKALGMVGAYTPPGTANPNPNQTPGGTTGPGTELPPITAPPEPPVAPAIDPNVAMNQAKAAFQSKFGTAMTPQQEQQLIASMGLQPGQPITQQHIDQALQTIGAYTPPTGTPKPGGTGGVNPTPPVTTAPTNPGTGAPAGAIDPNVAMNQAKAAFQAKFGAAMTPAEEQQLIAAMGLKPGEAVTQAHIDKAMGLISTYQRPGGVVTPPGTTPGPTPPGTLPQTGPLTPQPFNAPTIEDAPAFTAPKLELPDAYKSPDAFAYEKFKAPGEEGMLEDPGYQFRLKQGIGAREASAAGRGTLRTGDTLRELAQFNQEAASQEYGNVYNRRLGEHQMGFGQAQATDAINRGEGRYAYESGVNRAQTGYDAAFQGAAAEYAPRLATWNQRNTTAQRGAELQYDRDWQRELYGRDDAYRRERDRVADTYRGGRDTIDDAWRREVMEEERRRFLASQGGS